MWLFHPSLLLPGDGTSRESIIFSLPHTVFWGPWTKIFLKKQEIVFHLGGNFTESCLLFQEIA